MDRLPVQASPEELCSEREACLSGVGTYLPGTVGQGCRWFQAVSEPTSQVLFGRAAGCLSGVGTYLRGTVGQGYRLFKQCWNLPSGHRGRGAGCLSGVGTHLPGTVG